MKKYDQKVTMISWNQFGTVVLFLATVAFAKHHGGYSSSSYSQPSNGKTYLPQSVLDEFQGQPFCELPPREPHLPQCCSNRIDDCSRFVPKYNWTCYCDEFCETPYHSDCCPDYRSYCKGELKSKFIFIHHYFYKSILLLLLLFTISIDNCVWYGKRYQIGQKTKQNCNWW